MCTAVQTLPRLKLLHVVAQPLLSWPPRHFSAQLPLCFTLPLRQRCRGTCASLRLFPIPQVDQLKCKVTSLEEECSLLRKQAAAVPQREAEERGHPDTVSELWAENQRLMASLQELQGTLQVPHRAQLAQNHRKLETGRALWEGGCCHLWVWAAMGPSFQLCDPWVCSQASPCAFEGTVDPHRNDEGSRAVITQPPSWALPWCGAPSVPAVW